MGTSLNGHINTLCLIKRQENLGGELSVPRRFPKSESGFLTVHFDFDTQAVDYLLKDEKYFKCLSSML
jgi:hypothetical protein